MMSEITRERRDGLGRFGPVFEKSGPEMRAEDLKVVRMIGLRSAISR